MDPIVLSTLGTPIVLSRVATPRGGSSIGSLHEMGLASEIQNKKSCDSSRDDIIITPHIRLLPAKLGYFGYFFASGSFSAYLGVIFTAKGFSTPHIGLIVASIPFFSVFMLPVLTYLVDRFRCTHAALVTCSIMSSLFLVVFLGSNTVLITVVTFFALVVFQTPMNPLFDQHTLSMLPKESRVEAWGALRSFGAYGWGVGNPVAAFLVDAVGSWRIVSLQYAVGQLAVLYCMFTTRPYEAVERTPMRFHEVLLFLLLHRRLLLFLLASCLMGMGYTFINTFLFVFLESLGGSKLLMGLSLTMTVSTEIPIFRCSRVLHHWFTERQMLSLAMFIWSLRVFGYSLLQRPWMVLLLEPLHGATFGLMWLPGVRIVNTVYPPHLASSATGFLYMFVAGIGPIIGNIIAGNLYEILGPRMMFRTASIAMLCGLASYQLLDRVLERMELEAKGVGDTSSRAEMRLESPRCGCLDEEMCMNA
ncbi:MFS transporter, PPP family, 3-phenylpropionic acid transporter [Trypanosoma grayi]|uniref:MFS transporter, PPP family, 3-phenylpropionic acid transporter n=1 Tax=Trypanosoma grayi TaxID=71804 RepID=UPI0004F4A08E|nr:MFS transporter, PPP family, 3-phenylpropionic acid transporter [Trypanosoma grayi]KEG07923.1 MFS transporter, PPP family, 3-phenylpropionic acid transporter [Trypanosoma grayi]